MGKINLTEEQIVAALRRAEGDAGGGGLPQAGGQHAAVILLLPHEDQGLRTKARALALAGCVAKDRLDAGALLWLLRSIHAERATSHPGDTADLTLRDPPLRA